MVKIAIKPDGTVQYVDKAADQIVTGRRTRRRASHVLPVGLVRRLTFQLLRSVFSETGRVAAWTRRWRCPWTVSVVDGPQRVGPFTRRSEAIEWEVDWLHLNRLGR